MILATLATIFSKVTQVTQQKWNKLKSKHTKSLTCGVYVVQQSQSSYSTTYGPLIDHSLKVTIFLLLSQLPKVEKPLTMSKHYKNTTDA